MEVVHIDWRSEGRRGRMAVKVFREETPDLHWIETRTLAGSEFPANGLAHMIECLFPGQRWVAPSPYRVEHHQGYSGAVSVWVRVIHAKEWMDAPIIGGIRRSMSGRLRDGLRTFVWVLACIVEEHPYWFAGQEFEWIRILRPHWRPEDFVYPNEEAADPEPLLLLEAPGVLLEDPDEAVG